MKLRKLHVHNFRGILDETFHIDSYTLLVGPNNAGKSTVVDALRAFYENKPYKKDTDAPFIAAEDDESWAEATFSLNEGEFDSLAEEYRTEDHTLRVRKYFKGLGTRKAGCVYGYANGELSESQFYGDKNVQQGKLGTVIYIPAVSKVDDHTKMSGPSTLRELLSGILEDVVENSQAYTSLKKEFSRFSHHVRDEGTTDNRSLAGFENDFSALLQDWGIEFRLDLSPPLISDIIKQFVKYECIDDSHGKPLKPDQCGSGFQRHFIYSLLRLSTKFVSKKKAKKTKDFSPDLTLLLFEEPEAFLHPPQQDILSTSLRSLSETDAWQVICSTHSSHFVSRNMDQLPGIVRLKRDRGRVRSHQIRETEWRDILESNKRMHDIANKYQNLAKTMKTDDLRDEMEAVKYCLWMNPDRASAFFANNVLLVEGPTEQSLISRLIRESAVNCPAGGIYVLDCMGKFNIHRFMVMLSYLGTQHSVLYDDDNGKTYHPEIHQLISDTRDKIYTRHIEKIPVDIETLLCVPPPGNPHRKPQHLMFLYESDKIASDRLSALCEHVESCLKAFS